MRADTKSKTQDIEADSLFTHMIFITQGGGHDMADPPTRKFTRPLPKACQVMDNVLLTLQICKRCNGNQLNRGVALICHQTPLSGGPPTLTTPDPVSRGSVALIPAKRLYAFMIKKIIYSNTRHELEQHVLQSVLEVLFLV